jgi:hypothetical protein
LAVRKLIEVVSGKARELGGGVAAAFQHGAQGDYGGSSLAGDAQNMYTQEGSAYSTIGDTYAKEAGNAGEAQFLNVVQDSNKIARDLLSEILKVQGEIPGAAHDIYGELLSGQDKYRNYQIKVQKEQQDQYDRVYRRAKDQASMLNKGPWLYYVADTPQGPQVVLAKDKKGRPISTSGMSDYQKASLEARAADSAYRAASDVNKSVAGVVKDAAKPPKYYKNADGTWSVRDPKTGKLVKAPGYNPGKPVKPEKPGTKVILNELGVPMTKTQIQADIGNVHRALTAHGVTATAGDLELLIEDIGKTPIPAAIWRPIVAKKVGIPAWAVDRSKPMNRAALRNMGIVRLHRIAVFMGLDLDRGALRAAGRSKQELIDLITGA